MAEELKITYLENDNFEVEEIVPEQTIKTSYNLVQLKTRLTLLRMKLINFNKEIEKITAEQEEITALIPKLEAAKPVEPPKEGEI